MKRMTKKTVFYYLAIFVFICSIFASCDNDDNTVNYLIDYAPIYIDVYAEGANGEDLLAPGNGMDISTIQITCKSPTTGNDSVMTLKYAASTRAYLPIFSPYVCNRHWDGSRWTESGKYYIHIGGWDGGKTYDNETVTINWSNGRKDTFTFSSSANDTDVKRSFTHNGQKSSNEISITFIN